MDQPKISFVTSCYNSEQFLDGLIENLLQQTEEDVELVIVDSASTDGSVDIIKKWEKIDPRIKLIQQATRTPYGVSWLVGWEASKGCVVTNSNTDDRSYPWRSTQVFDAHVRQSFMSDSRGAFYYGGYETRVNNTATAKGVPPAYSEEDMSQFFRCGVHVHWDNSLKDRVDWDKMYQAAQEYKSAFDYWLVLYFMSLGVKGIAIPNCFSIYNQRADSLEQSDKERNTFESLRAIETFYPNGRSITDLEEKSKIESPEFYKRYRDFVAQFD